MTKGGSTRHPPHTGRPPQPGGYCGRGRLSERGPRGGGGGVGGVMAWLRHTLCDGVIQSGIRRKLQTPGSAEEHKRQGKPTINPNDRPQAYLTDQGTCTIEWAAQESRRITPTSTAAVLASSTATTRHHYLHPTNRVFTRSSQL